MKTRIVITGIGLTAPNGNNLAEFRQALLEGKSGVTEQDIRYVGKCPVGICHFDETKYQKMKTRKRGTRAGSIAIYSANEALHDGGIDLSQVDRERVGIYLGITEHGTIELDAEMHNMIDEKAENADFWSPHHNPRTVANAPAGEVALNLQITGPHYTIGAACAAGNLGVITAAQMLELGQIDMALAGGISECAHSFVLFAAFKAQSALASHDNAQMASRPLDADRNGIVISEGGCVFVVERLEDALKRHAKIYAEIVGYHCNTDATSFVLPDMEGQYKCMKKSIEMANLRPEDIDLVSMHATGTPAGDLVESNAIIKLFGDHQPYVNVAKGFIGHAMGAAGALELAGNIPSFFDKKLHSCLNIDRLDPDCGLEKVLTEVTEKEDVQYIMNNSFGMLGLNSTVILKRYDG